MKQTTLIWLMLLILVCAVIAEDAIKKEENLNVFIDSIEVSDIECKKDICEAKYTMIYFDGIETKTYESPSLAFFKSEKIEEIQSYLIQDAQNIFDGMFEDIEEDKQSLSLAKPVYDYETATWKEKEFIGEPLINPFEPIINNEPIIGDVPQ